MKILKNKTAIIALILMLTFSAILTALPMVGAHDPPWNIPTWCYVAVAPETAGVGQEALIAFWLNAVPPTASGIYGDRWSFTVDITKPDGTIEELGPIVSDPVGGAYTIYTPDQAGTYTIVSHHPDEISTGALNNPAGENPAGIFTSGAYVNDTYLASTSDTVTLTVTQEPLPTYQETPLPTDYWTRPIYGANRDWSNVAANWLGGAAQQDGPTTNFGFGPGPESAHILWTRPYWSGGIMDIRTGSVSYYTGLSYESFNSPGIILEGKLYYTVEAPPRYGWYCVDLYTGETIYFQNTTGPVTGISYRAAYFSGDIPYGAPAFGQVYDYQSPNQHGGFPYLWVTSTGKTGTWDMLDAFTGNYICSIANVSSSGTAVYGKEGSILRYRINNGRLTCWNTSRAIWWNPIYLTTTWNTYWAWRPGLNKTYDGNNGFSLNVSIPDVSGSIRAVREGEFIIGGSAGSNNEQGTTPGVMWCLSLEQGKEGTLLWNRTFTPPSSAGNITVSIGAVDPEDGVFLFEDKLNRQRWGYSLETGQLLWGPTESEPQFNFYGMSDDVYKGRLYSYGYGGVLIAYNITTGIIDWTWSAPDEGFGETFYPHSPLSRGVIADGKLYMYSTEHSPTIPLRRDANIWCIDAETGQLIWKMSSWPNSGVRIADGHLVLLNLFDNSLYCYGKGPSATTVTASPKVSVQGSSVTIEGTVTDQSPSGRRNINYGLDFTLKGTPAISDADMEAWMEYLYQQRPIPEDAQGVNVKLTAIDPNGNYQDIGYATSDITGNFATSWQPPVPGEYFVTAEFEGSASYGSSFATAFFVVDKAPSPGVPIEPEPTTPEPTTPEPTTPEPTTPEPTEPEPTTPEPTEPEPTEPTEAPFITTEIAIIAAIAVACVIGIVSYWALKKRK